MIAILFQGVVSGIVLAWPAHAVWPEPPAAADLEQVASPLPAQVDNPIGRALANALILLVAVTICLTKSAFSSAVVFPITVASLLLQLDLATSARAATGLVVVNLLGGVLASLAFSVVYAGALTTFLILFGTGISPLPASTPDSFTTRVSFMPLAVAHTLCMTALFWLRPAARRVGEAPACLRERRGCCVRPKGRNPRVCSGRGPRIVAPRYAFTGSP